MPLTEIHIGLLRRAAGQDVLMAPRIGGKATALRELFRLGLLEQMDRRIGNRVMNGFKATAAGKKILAAHEAGTLEETRVPVIPVNPVGRVVIYGGRVVPVHHSHVEKDELGEYVEVIGIKGENDV
jgi:hypothetical protein